MFVTLGVGRCVRSRRAFVRRPPVGGAGDVALPDAASLRLRFGFLDHVGIAGRHRPALPDHFGSQVNAVGEGAGAARGEGAARGKGTCDAVAR